MVRSPIKDGTEYMQSARLFWRTEDFVYGWNRETIGTSEDWEVTEEGNYKETEFYMEKCMMLGIGEVSGKRQA